MEEADKRKILNFLSGNVSVKEFESWVYNNSELESRLGTDCFFDLINADFNNKESVYAIKSALLGKYIDLEELKNFKYHKILEQAGWFDGRKMKKAVETKNLQPELKHAWNILSEFGGLELITTYESDYWTPRNIKFPETIEQMNNGARYGLEKKLICFANIDDYNSALYVDDENNFYQLDDIASIKLYQFKGKEFSKMIQNLLGLDEEGKFELIGNSSEKNGGQRPKKR
ncbi:SUKH-3 domain-containing protein [Flammeovirga sp. OC4]|uniref:SUKH-3 domain-containing protein n=1 Tax=Flammeovirga sp. OC4 TaxID=1382345 RepID=UPI0005C796D1|nr:SUKH-3 domain-containing protein [Flammeovirga sp. OC4]